MKGGLLLRGGQGKRKGGKGRGGEGVGRKGEGKLRPLSQIPEFAHGFYLATLATPWLRP